MKDYQVTLHVVALIFGAMLMAAAVLFKAFGSRWWETSIVFLVSLAAVVWALM